VGIIAGALSRVNRILDSRKPLLYNSVMAKKRRHNTPERIDPNEIPTRDLFMLMILTGATKSGTHTDEKKEKNRRACRGQHNCEE
jgi:hypothetical protein